MASFLPPRIDPEKYIFKKSITGFSCQKSEVKCMMSNVCAGIHYFFHLTFAICHLTSIPQPLNFNLNLNIFHPFTDSAPPSHTTAGRQVLLPQASLWENPGRSTSSRMQFGSTSFPMLSTYIHPYIRRTDSSGRTGHPQLSTISIQYPAPSTQHLPFRFAHGINSTMSFPSPAVRKTQVSLNSTQNPKFFHHSPLTNNF